MLKGILVSSYALNSLGQNEELAVFPSLKDQLMHSVITNCQGIFNGEFLLYLVCLNFVSGSFVFQMQPRLGLHDGSQVLPCCVVFLDLTVPPLYLLSPLCYSFRKEKEKLRRDEIWKDWRQLGDMN